MPLTKGQIEALSILSASRDPESYVAGATPLNRDQIRFSDDVDIFNDSEQRAAEAAEAGATALAAAGFDVTWIRASAMLDKLKLR